MLTPFCAGTVSICLLSLDILYKERRKHKILGYCYANRNDQYCLTLRTINKSYISHYNEFVTSKPPTTSKVNKIHTNKYIEHDSSKPITISIREKGADKFEIVHIQAVAIEFSRTRTLNFENILQNEGVRI